MITFRTENFRTLTEGAGPTSKIRVMDTSTLILVKTSGEALYARTRGDKDALVARFTSDDLLLWAWVGQWNTDIFQLTKDDLQRYYR